MKAQPGSTIVSSARTDTVPRKSLEPKRQETVCEKSFPRGEKKGLYDSIDLNLALLLAGLTLKN
jgi:hypothetical protein